MSVQTVGVLLVLETAQRCECILETLSKFAISIERHPVDAIIEPGEGPRLLLESRESMLAQKEYP